MRHINQMTLKELNEKIVDVESKRRACNGKDQVMWQRMYNLGNRLQEEARKRAEAFSDNDNAELVGIVID